MSTGTPQTIETLIDEAIVANNKDGFRRHLGASIIGKTCERELWLSFRWAKKPTFPARMLRLFNRGHREEDILLEYLSQAGITVFPVDPDTGKQYRISDHSGHFGGSCDGQGYNHSDILLNPATNELLPAGSYFLLEFKTSNAKQFASLVKKKVASAKPVHYAQMQIYMDKLDLDIALYVAVNKDDDSIYYEWVKRVPENATYHLEKAGSIIAADSPPLRINESPGWYECKFCDMHSLCQTAAEMPEINCRTCAHSTPLLTPDLAKEISGDAAWVCAKHDFLITEEYEETGCTDHQYHPHIIDRHFTYEGGDYYTNKAGVKFRNEKDHVASVEMGTLL